MKILFLPAHYVFDDHEYGTEPDLAYNIVNRIALLNKGSVVVTGRSNLLDEPAYTLIELQPNSHGFSMSLPNAIKFNVQYTLKALRLLHEEQFDLLHHVRPFTIGATFNLAVLIGAHKNMPFCIGAFCMPYDEGDPPSHMKKQVVLATITHIIEKLVKRVVAPLSRATLRKADAIFVVDRQTKKLVQAIAPQTRALVVPPGKDKARYRIKTAKLYKRGQLDFLSAGNFIPLKGFGDLIVAFSKVVRSYPDARLKIAGSGYEYRNLYTLVSALKVSKSVIFVGRVQNSSMPNIYESADIYVSMPRFEALGHTYIEALAAGLPIITTATNGSQEILAEKSFSKIVAQGDIEGMASQMIQFLDKPEIIPTLSAAARSEFERTYDWGVIIPQYVKVYRELTTQINEKKH